MHNVHHYSNISGQIRSHFLCQTSLSPQCQDKFAKWFEFFFITHMSSCSWVVCSSYPYFLAFLFFSNLISNPQICFHYFFFNWSYDEGGIKNISNIGVIILLGGYKNHETP